MKPQRSSRRPRRLLRLLGVLLVVLLLGWLAALRMERWGRDFFLTGQSVVGTLGAMSEALSSGDSGALAELYSPEYGGELLGLNRLEPASEKDGVRRSLFRSEGAAPDRAAAVEEWRRYLAGFEAVEEVGLHLHRVLEWSAGGPVDALVRFELIGTPVGAPRAVIDRAYFRMRWVPGGEGLAVAESSLLADDPSLPAHRVAGDAPQFVDVAGDAGVGFENRYYPPFVELPLRFAMIRYGPAGITAADFDADGLYDLFIPDGVESRLFRNRGDGTFADVTEEAGLAGLSGVSVGLFADFDNDGDLDFFVSRTFEPNQLFDNRGDGTFREVTAGSGLGADCCTTVASVADYDNDGDLDLYVGRYLDPREKIPTTFYARNGEPNRLYRNRGDGTF